MKLRLKTNRYVIKKDKTMKTSLSHIMIALLLCLGTASAQQYYLLQTATGKGGSSHATSSSYTMDNTIGQSTAGSASSSGYSLTGGFNGGLESLGSFFGPFEVAQGWNLLSVPHLSADFNTTALFPGAISPAYTFSTSTGYTAQNVLENGRGFWIKFSSPGSVGLSGVIRSTDSVEVQAGWNIVGPMSFPVNAAGISSEPGGIIASSFYGYSGAYASASTLMSGQGYWVKASAPGVLILTPGSGSTPPEAPSDEFLADADEFIVSEKSGMRRVLHLESMPTAAGAKSELPPQGPEGTFDARFESQKSIELVSGDKVILIQSSEYPVTISWNTQGRTYTLRDGVTGSIIEPRRISGTGELTITNPAVNRLILTSEGIVPHEFALAQNYPNPFNPSTTIRFTVKDNAQTTLEVFDILGQRVATLFNDNAEPGRYYDVKMDGMMMASGVYFYTLTSGAKVDSRKMLLIK